MKGIVMVIVISNMQSFFKKILTPLILVSFLVIAIFSFAIMTHGSEGQMSGDCPFSPMGVSLCPQDTVAIAMHHISAYTSFTNVPINPSITVLIILFLLFSSSLAFILTASPPLSRIPVTTGYIGDFSLSTPHSREITRWLSLLENSPSQY